MPGFKALTSLMQFAKCSAPPSNRSSLSTDVITTYFNPWFDCTGYFMRFFDVQWFRLSVCNITKCTAPGAFITHDHESNCFVRKALHQVGAEASSHTVTNSRSLSKDLSSFTALICSDVNLILGFLCWAVPWC